MISRGEDSVSHTRVEAPPIEFVVSGLDSAGADLPVAESRAATAACGSGLSIRKVNTVQIPPATMATELSTQNATWAG
jgi:hypothetical protein